MRTNLPVTGREHHYPDDATLMSVTDPDSRVRYANAAFVTASGFEREQLQGQPHNLVRHPDMPPEAFADMWRTLQEGDSWSALVKNRRQDGDHYWVRANAAPIQRGKRVLGYISVRTSPERREVEQAERLYGEMRAGRARHLRLHKGIVVRRGLLTWTSFLRILPLRWRLRAPLAAYAATAAALVLANGMSWLVVAGLAALTVLCIAWLEADIERPLQRVLGQARQVAAGTVDARVHLNRVDEIGMLMRAVTQAGLNTRALVDDVAEQVNGLAEAGAEISQGNDDLSHRTERAAASLQETAAAMRQLGDAFRTSVQVARGAGAATGQAAQHAQHGETVVETVVKTMEGITSSSRRMGDIIGVIDGIAFQTNILSLNAAVEAARAGEQGPGLRRGGCRGPVAGQTLR